MASFLSDTLSVGISKVLVIAFGLATSVVVARWVGPEGNGLIAGLLVYPSLFMTIGSLGIRQAVTFYVGNGSYELEKIKTAIVQIWALSTMICLISSFLLVRYLSTAGENLLLVLLAIAPLPFSLFNTYNTGVFLGGNKIKAFNRINWLPSLFIFAATIVLVVIVPFDTAGALLALITGPALMFGILLFKNRFVDSFSLQFDRQLIFSLLKLGSVYAISLLVINLNYRLDIILLDNLSTPTELGIYSKGSHLIQHMWQIPMLLSTIVFARSSSAKDKDAFSRKIIPLMHASVLFVGVACVCLAIVARPLITLLYGQSFLESASVLQILLPGVVLLTVFKVMNMDLAGRGKPWIQLGAMLPALFVNGVLSTTLIPTYGADGAAISSTFSYSLAGVIFLVLYCRETKQTLRSALVPNFVAIFKMTLPQLKVVSSIGKNGKRSS